MSTRKLRMKEESVYFGAFTCSRWIPPIHATSVWLARAFGRLRERDR